MTYTAFVPARSGSKRLPHKNVKLLAGKPLVAWTLEACVGASQVDTVILSTDSEEYWDIACEYVSSDKLVLDFRSSDEAGDKVKIFDYLKSSHEKIFSDRDGAFILALPTVPLRREDQIDAAIKMYEDVGAPVFSASPYGFSVSFAFQLAEENGWEPLFEDSPMLTGNTRSQDQKSTYHPNGAIYVRSISDLAKPGLKTLYDGAVPYVMDANSSVDVDNDIDFSHAEAILRVTG